MTLLCDANNAGSSSATPDEDEPDVIDAESNAWSKPIHKTLKDPREDKTRGNDMPETAAPAYAAALTAASRSISGYAASM